MRCPERLKNELSSERKASTPKQQDNVCSLFVTVICAPVFQAVHKRVSLCMRSPVDADRDEGAETFPSLGLRRLPTPLSFGCTHFNRPLTWTIRNNESGELAAARGAAGWCLRWVKLQAASHLEDLGYCPSDL